MLLGTNLKKLTIGGKLEEIDTETLITVINNLEEANLGDWFGLCILQKLFVSMTKDTKLRALSISGDFPMVDSTVFGKAINRLTKVVLRPTYSYPILPISHFLAILNGICDGNSCLKSLSLWQVAWSSVTPQYPLKSLLMKALQKCKISLYQPIYEDKRQLVFDKMDILSFARCDLCGELTEDMHQVNGDVYCHIAWAWKEAEEQEFFPQAKEEEFLHLKLDLKEQRKSQYNIRKKNQVKAWRRTLKK